MLDYSRYLACAAAAVVAFGTIARAAPCPIAGQHPMLVVQLFLGEDSADGKSFSGKAWQAFLRDAVTPAFPDGFTVFDAYGQWRDPMTSKIGRERSRVLEIGTADTPDARIRIANVAARYHVRFHQQSVGIVTMPGCGAF